MFQVTALVGLCGVAALGCMLTGCSRLRRVEPEEFKRQVELRNAQSMYWSVYIGQADGRAFLLRKRIPLIGKKGREEVLYTETSELGADYLKELEAIKDQDARASGGKRREGR